MRRWTDRAFRGLTHACALFAGTLFVVLAAVLAYRALAAGAGSALDSASTASTVSVFGALTYQLLGTLVLVSTALFASVPVATALALLQGVYCRSTRVGRWSNLMLLTLNGIPSIVFGILGFAFFVRFLGWGKSWLAGGLILGLMILPTLTVALAERIQALPRRYIDAAAGLGLDRGQIVRAVILPQSAGGLVSGALLGLARAAGETAPILFAAAVFAGVTVPTGVRDSPVLALPYHIFVKAQDSFAPEAQAELWAAAFLLLVVVTGLSALALPLRLRLRPEGEAA